MTKNYQIVWQKWQDELVDSIEEDKDIDNNSDEIEDIEEEYNEHPIAFAKKQPILITPMGILPYNEAMACNKLFNLWVGHTNFTITKTISDILEMCDGVEALDIFTRYRFRIAVGQAFSDSAVMRNINNKIYDYLYESNQ